MTQDSIGVALLGLGTVGAEVARAILHDSDRIGVAVGRSVDLRGVAVRSLTGDRSVQVEPSALTTEASDLIARTDVDVVVEVIGGIEPARTFIETALRAGKRVVTANKAVVARHGAELTKVASQHGGALWCEAAAVGAVPIVRAIRASLAGDRVLSVAGILNGTCNYILTQMTEHGTSFDDALADAQAKGYAEADPTSDISGEDAAYKLALLAGFGFGRNVSVADIDMEGIAAVTAGDIAQAEELGYVIKQVASVSADSEGRLDASVRPMLVARSHPLASVSDVFNAVWVQALDAGPLMFYGRGAGGSATASAVLGDLVDACKRDDNAPDDPLVPAQPASMSDPDDAIRRHYCRIEVVDQPGVLAQIAGAFGTHGVSIETMIQRGRNEDPVDLVFITHEGRSGALREALDDIGHLPVVHTIAARFALLQ